MKSQFWGKTVSGLASSLWCGACFTFHIKQWLDEGVWPAPVVMLCSLSVPVHSPEHWKIEDYIPSFPGKNWDHITYLVLCGTDINEKSSFPWGFTEITSLRQGITGPNQGQCHAWNVLGMVRWGEQVVESKQWRFVWVQLHSILKL